MGKKIIALLWLGLLIIVPSSFLWACAETDVPVLSVGDRWKYEWVNEPVLGITRTEIIDRIEDFEGVQCYVLIRSMLEVDPESDYVRNMTKTVWITSDWVILKTDDLEILPDMEQRVTKIYSPGIKLYDFPLSVGKEWSGRSYIVGTVVWTKPGGDEGTSTGSEYVDWIRKVVSTETITVPAGTFDTYVVEELIFGDGQRFWFSVDAKNYVKMEYFGEYYVGEGEEVLTGYEFASQGNGSRTLHLIIGIAAVAGFLGFTIFLYYRNHHSTRDW